MTELLFSHGTLRQRDVQLATFGHQVGGHLDAIVGYELDQVMTTIRRSLPPAEAIDTPSCAPSTHPGAHVDGTVFTVYAFAG